MNKRIIQLSKQAGDYVNETYTGPVRSKTPGKIWEDGHVGWHTQFNEKFAELIVQECIDIAQDRAAFDGFPPNDVNHIIDEIKQHFGVEE
jgi:hypothetical protein